MPITWPWKDCLGGFGVGIDVDVDGVMLGFGVERAVRRVAVRRNAEDIVVGLCRKRNWRKLGGGKLKTEVSKVTQIVGMTTRR